MQIVDVVRQVAVHDRFQMWIFAGVKTCPACSWPAAVTPLSAVPFLKAPSQLSLYLYRVSG